MKFNEDLAAVHAYLCADGYVIKNPKMQIHKYYLIGLRNTNETLLLDFQRRFNEFFGLTPIICKDGRCRIQNKDIYHFLTSDFSYYSHEWKMPKLSKRNLSFWLRAFFDCEAWVFVKKGQDRRIGVDSVNEKGLYTIKQELSKYFNIDSRIKKVEKRNLCRLYIYGRDNFEKFRNHIGFLHPDKRKKLDEAINSYVDYRWHFPENKLKIRDFIINIIKIKAKLKKPNTIRFTSIVKENLVQLSGLLHEHLRIKSKLYSRKNKHSKYFELAVYNKEDTEKLLNFRKIYKPKI